MNLKLNRILYWLCYAWYLYIIGPSALSKIFQVQHMVDSMLSLGFNKTWTVIIGVLETIGVSIVVAGLFKPPLRTLGILFLLPFAIGAFTTHMAHQEYHHFYNALFLCVLSLILLILDRRVKIELHEKHSHTA